MILCHTAKIQIRLIITYMNEILRYIYDIEMLVSIQIVSYTFTKARYISGHDYVNVESPH